jgi:hypothetical protein
MTTSIVYSNLELADWTTQSGSNVNPVPADLYVATQESGVLQVTNYSSRPMGGALVTHKIPLPVLNGVTLCSGSLSMECYISSLEMPNLARLEIDTKICIQGAPNASTPIRNVCNFSSQVNLSTGQWQIDGDPPGWKDTGFKPQLPSNTWFPIVFDYDWMATAFSFMMASFAGQAFQVPATMQNVPLQTTNWQPVIALQIQHEIMQPGVCSLFFRNIAFHIGDAA